MKQRLIVALAGISTSPNEAESIFLCVGHFLVPVHGPCLILLTPSGNLHLLRVKRYIVLIVFKI
jgi:hypothetical protein